MHGEHGYRPWGWSALLNFFFEITLPADSRCFCSFLQVVLHCWKTLLIILFTPLSEMLRESPGCGWFLVKWLWSDCGPNSAHWNLQYFKNSSVTSAISIFCNNKVAKVLQSIMRFLCDTLAMSLFISHQVGLNKLILICTAWQDCVLITDRFQLLS